MVSSREHQWLPRSISCPYRWNRIARESWFRHRSPSWSTWTGWMAPTWWRHMRASTYTGSSGLPHQLPRFFAIIWSCSCSNHWGKHHRCHLSSTSNLDLGRHFCQLLAMAWWSWALVAPCWRRRRRTDWVWSPCLQGPCPIRWQRSMPTAWMQLWAFSCFSLVFFIIYNLSNLIV